MVKKITKLILQLIKMLMEAGLWFLSRPLTVDIEFSSGFVGTLASLGIQSKRY